MAEFSVVDSIDLPSNGSGNSGTHWRIIIPAASVLADASTLKVLVDHVAAWSFSSMWIGHRGSGYDFDGSQVQVFFGGNPGLAVTAETWSDEVTYSVDETKDLIISLAVTSSALTYGNSAGKTSGYYSGGDASAAATASGPMTGASYIVAFKGLNGVAPIADIDLISVVATGGAVAGGEAGISSFVGLTSYSVVATGGAVAGGRAEAIFSDDVGVIKEFSFIDYPWRSANLDLWGAGDLDWRADIPYIDDFPLLGVATYASRTPVAAIQASLTGSAPNSPGNFWGGCLQIFMHW